MREALFCQQTKIENLQRYDSRNTLKKTFQISISWNYFYLQLKKKIKFIAITRTNSNEQLAEINNSIDSSVHSYPKLIPLLHTHIYVNGSHSLTSCRTLHWKCIYAHNSHFVRSYSRKQILIQAATGASQGGALYSTMLLWLLRQLIVSSMNFFKESDRTG